MAFKSNYWKGEFGVPALIFGEMKDVRRYKMGYEEQRNSLHKIYSYLRAELPEKTFKGEIDWEHVQGLLNKISEEIKIANKKVPEETGEEVVRLGEDLELVRALLDGIFEMETEIISITGILSEVREKIGTMPKADE